jgi:hypothetical protein
MGRDRDGSEEDNLTLPVGVALPIRIDAVNIVVLCQRILAVGSKVAPDARVSTEMTARVAYMASLVFFHHNPYILTQFLAFCLCHPGENVGAESP